MWNFWKELFKAKQEVTIVLFDADGNREEGYQNFVVHPKKSLQKMLYISFGLCILVVGLIWGIKKLDLGKGKQYETQKLLNLQKQVDANEEYILQLRRLLTEDGEVRLDESHRLKQKTVVPGTDSFVFPFEAPLKGFVTRGFQAENSHFGIDVAVETGTPVRAVASGRVIFSDKTEDAGQVIAVQHVQGYTTIYKHNKEILKSIGNLVNKGDTLAFSGNSGEITTGPHLHFEIWQNGQALDPKPFVLNW